MLIQISSGQGPVECSVGVEKLCKAFLKEFTGSRIVSVNEDYSGNGYKSCVMEFDEDVSMLEGTVLWVWKSTIRPGHQRKNWYMDVSVIKEAEAVGGLDRYGENVAASLIDTLSHSAENMEIYAKANRPWTDRTGNARRTMEGVFARDGDRFTAGVEGHMPYSVFLELGFDGRYAILAPTVRHFAPDVLLQFAGGLAGLR